MSAGSLIGTLTNLIIVGAVWAVGGLVVIKVMQYANTLGLSADAMNVIFYLSVAYGVSGVLYLIASVLNHWINSASEASMGV